jgi:hypothetical protein
MPTTYNGTAQINQRVKVEYTLQYREIAYVVLLFFFIIAAVQFSKVAANKIIG